MQDLSKHSVERPCSEVTKYRAPFYDDEDLLQTWASNVRSKNVRDGCGKALKNKENIGRVKLRHGEASQTGCPTQDLSEDNVRGVSRNQLLTIEILYLTLVLSPFSGAMRS